MQMDIQDRTTSHTDMAQPRPGDVGRSAGGRTAAVATVAIVGFVLLGLVVIGLGLLITDVLAHGAVGRWDASVNEWFVAQRTPTLNTVTRYGSDLGATLTIVVIAVVSAIALAVAHRWRLVTFLAISMVVEVTVFLTATIAVDRPRPDVPRLDVSPPTASYPSGHTAASIALYVALAIIVTTLTANRLARVVVWVLALALPVVVGISRLYRGMHHPTDVLASVLLGAGALTIATLAVRAGWHEGADPARRSS